MGESYIGADFRQPLSPSWRRRQSGKAHRYR